MTALMNKNNAHIVMRSQYTEEVNVKVKKNEKEKVEEENAKKLCNKERKHITYVLSLCPCTCIYIHACT